MTTTTSTSPAAVRHARLAWLFAATLALSACGGGGGYGGTPIGGTPSAPSPSPAGPTPPASAVAQSCAPTNPYRADATSATTVGSLSIEKAWVKWYMEGAYLWWEDMPSVNASAAAYSNTADVEASLDAYFKALKSPLYTASGKRKDEFSFTYPTKAWNDLSQSGSTAGYGIEWYFGSPTPPRGLRVAFVEPNSPAAAAGVRRGDTLVSTDGVSADVNTKEGVDTLNAALFPSSNGSTHSFVFTPVIGGTRSVSLTSATVIKTPVPTTQVLTTGAGRRVGYMLFNDHIATAEGQLITAVNTLRDAAVQDLVLDLRYNGGGYLYIASELAYMVAGASRTSDKLFEHLQYNSKRTADTNAADARTPFYDTSCYLDSNFKCTRQESLPTLNLSRVFVLTSSGTCSASEAIINGLRGVDVEVVLIGDTTCGKPYGFTAKDNCGISYFPIEFKGVNAKGFGDYADGFAATCSAQDDYSRALGDPAEGQLAAALYRLDNGACNPALGRAAPKAAGANATKGGLLRGPERENRILLPR
ncbi:MAG: peptidase S41 [Ideonella sp. MAG2]|nr:MAG: peptidase S41 [Ideonella sp. MAG2]